ncbi:MAG: acetyl-CoA carboxylase biotin carboxyl carrier protein [Planctomycetota bacterium]|nr:acetyl-CoA carboxylase biotin carboxyl carrier protein [Planctomycetota bacterium]
MIDIRKLKELVKLMVANDLAEMDLRDTDEQVTIRRHGETFVTATPAAPVATAPAAPAVPAVATQEAEVEGEEIVSPMVGTFYSSPDPDSPAFVSVGDEVSEDTTVCIMEAMKIFNEIKAQVSGKIVKVLVKSGDPVEFGQPLFIVRT